MELELRNKVLLGARRPEDVQGFLTSQGVAPGDIAEAVNTLNYQKEKVSLRKDISKQAGDTLSILGTTSDAAQLLLFEVGKLAIAINQASSLDDVKIAAQPLNDLLATFVSKVDSGEVKLTNLEKGNSSVIEDVEQRCTSVCAVMFGN